MPVEPSDAEEQYFKKLEAEQRKQLRKKLDKQAGDLKAQRAIEQSVGTDDDAIAERIRALGFDGDTARVFDLLPLIHVAWADGTVQRGERGAILKVVEKRGITPSSEAFMLIESLLEERPTDTYMEESLSVLRDLVSGQGDKAKSIVDLCRAVATASGGFLGFGAKVGDEERELIEQIATALGDQAQELVRDELG